jgi:ATP-dependent helicase HrpB
MAALPIHSVLSELLATLARRNSAVLVAPPGAGKTTAVAPALIGESWCSGSVIILSPRRVAARAAAERMAEMLGERPGETVGYLTRMDSRRSAQTRILVMTEAIFVAQILKDQELAGVSAVLFDEAHERHLDSDLGLALALETRSVLRPDLRLVVMSATLDGARFAGLLGEDGTSAAVIESAGSAHPLAIRWLGARPELRLEDAVASAILTAWREEVGDLLAFLPGVGEIERVRERLAEKLPAALILPLHGQCEPAEQRAAIRRDPQGRRRIVLATSIAETSLTLDGVSVVVDSGVSRRAEFDRAAGVTHLVTTRASQSAAAQRAGRAARQRPGVAYRLWEEAAHPGRPEFDAPEMLTADLAALVLALARWGAGDPASLRWLDPPPAPSIASARQRLSALGALDGEGRITLFGEQVAALPMEPWQAAMVLFGAETGAAEKAARLALLLQERGLGGRGDDLLQRLSRWDAETHGRAEAARKLAQRWAKQAVALVKSGAAHRGRSEDTGGHRIPASLAVNGVLNPALFLGLVMPDNIARRRDASGESWISAGGRGYVLDGSSPLARAEWLAIGDAQGSAKGARITAAAVLETQEVEQALADRIERRSILHWNDSERRVEARLERRLGAITLASGPDPAPDQAAVAALLLEQARTSLDQLLPASLLARARHAGLHELACDTLDERAEEWLAPLLAQRRDLDLDRGRVADAALALLDWDARQRLDRIAPREFATPAGTRHTIDYAHDGGPAVEVRVQAMFGLDQHPLIGTTPLLLKLTSPAGRPIQATRDLPQFWRGSWQDVKKEMKGRYPKHRWPDEPWAEKPSLKTKNAFSRSEG